MQWRAQFPPYIKGLRLRCELNRIPFVVDKRVVTELKQLPYKDQWLVCKARGWYHVYMDDNAIFNFSLDPKPSFSFLDCPIDAMPFSEFLAQEREADPSITRHDLVGQYEEYLATCPPKAALTPIRYDFDPTAYRPGIHPAAHVHVGLDNHIRIGLRRELTPLAFFLFVVRQRYPRHWEYLLDHALATRLPRLIREELDQVGKYQSKDDFEHYLV